MQTDLQNTQNTEQQLLALIRQYIARGGVELVQAFHNWQILFSSFDKLNVKQKKEFLDIACVLLQYFLENELSVFYNVLHEKIDRINHQLFANLDNEILHKF